MPALRRDWRNGELDIRRCWTPLSRRRLALLDIGLHQPMHGSALHLSLHWDMLLHRVFCPTGLVTYVTDSPHLYVEMDRCFTGVQSTTSVDFESIVDTVELEFVCSRLCLDGQFRSFKKYTVQYSSIQYCSMGEKSRGVRLSAKRCVTNKDLLYWMSFGYPGLTCEGNDSRGSTKTRQKTNKNTVQLQARVPDPTLFV